MVWTARLRTLLVLLLTASALYLGTLNLLDRLRWQQADDGLRWLQTESGVELDSTAPHLQSAGIQPGARLVDIDGIPIRDLNDYTEVTEVLAQSSESGTVADYTLRTAAGHEVTSPVRIELRSRLGARDIPLLLVGILFLATGLFIFLRNWRAEGAFHFYFIGLVAFILLFFRFSGRADTFDIAIYWCSAVAFLLLPPLFLHFCCYFPRPLNWMGATTAAKSVLYLPGTILLSFHAFWFTGSLKEVGFPRTPSVEGFLDRFELAHFLLFFALAVTALVWRRRHTHSPIERRQLKWLTHGTAFALIPFALLYALPYLLGLPIYFWMEFSVLSLGLIPLSFAYSIARYRLMDVDIIFKRGAAYAIASSALLAIYVTLALLLASAVQDFSPESGFLLLGLAALVIAFFFAPLRDVVQEQIDRYFYRDRYGYRRSIAEFGRTLASEVDLDRLTSRIAERIEKALGASSVAIFSRDGEDQVQLCAIRDTSQGKVQERVTLTSRLIDSWPEGQAQKREHLADSTLHDQLRDLGISYLQPMRVRNRVIGLLGVGTGSDADLLSTEDLDMLEMFSQYASIAIDNALLYRTLQQKATELSELKAYNEAVIESITLGVSVISPDGSITVWNRAMESLTNRSAGKTIGSPIEDVLPQDLVRAMKEVAAGPGWMLDGLARVYKANIAESGQDARLANVTLSPFFTQDGRNTGTLVVLDDITEKVRLENQLLQAEKLSSIGLFAAGLAHEVNTPLAGISSYSQSLLEETDENDPRYETLKKIEKQSFRASEIINNLLNFARFKDSEFERLNLNSLVSETVSLLEHQFRSGRVQLDLDLEPSLPETVGNGGKLQQVFMNLLLNAKDAMPDGGNLTVRTATENGDVIVEVKDDGVGISQRNIKKIYDPFFTTKGVGEGTGLGLSISYGIIQEHSGRIQVTSRPGEGTTFRLELPVRRVQ